MRRLVVALALLALACDSKKTAHDQIKYLQHSKTAEAKVMLGKLVRNAKSYFAENAAYPAGAIGPTPAPGSCCAEAGHKCAPRASDWTAPLWSTLLFDMDDPFYYSYAYESDGKTFTARAFGDLDCNGKYSTFEMTDQGSVSVTAEDE